MKSLGEMNEAQSDLAQVVRLALSNQSEDVRLFVARLVRKYRGTEPELAAQLELFLRAKPARNGGSPLRRAPTAEPCNAAVPIDDESRLSLLRTFSTSTEEPAPLLSPALEETLTQLIHERQQAARLISAGLQPTRSAIFIGKPGVGKTLTARWLASQLKLPLYILDLTAVMSSLLGRTGSNLRAALDYAKKTPCVLLLDEIDAVAKRRSDDADIGELKRLVTVMLQEVDEWPASGLLLAATNHPELIDTALWRRFDLTVTFEMPGPAEIKGAIRRFLANDYAVFGRWHDMLAFAFKGASFNDIERELQRFRRALALGTASDAELIEEFMRTRAAALDRPSRIELALQLAQVSRLSQHTISTITGVSRDTIRKYTAKAPVERKKRI